jgi:hypothetical protein
MYQKLVFRIRQKCHKCVALFLALAFLVGASANDGKPAGMPRTLVPVSNYQWFMIGVAITYTVCLIIRYRRRSARRKAANKT